MTLLWLIAVALVTLAFEVFMTIWCTKNAAKVGLLRQVRIPVALCWAIMAAQLVLFVYLGVTG